MKVLVPVKRVMDAYVSVRLKSDGSGIEDNKMSINPFDDIAIEEAVRLKEAGHIIEIIAITIGNKLSQETLRHALALGADRGIHILSEQTFESFNIAKIIEFFVTREDINLVIMGKQAIDYDNNQTGQMLAGLLDWPQHTFVSNVEFLENKIKTVREIDGGLETLTSSLPAVITTDLRLNEPRYASLPNIMKAKRKSIEILEFNDLDFSLSVHSEILSYKVPTKREAGEMLADVDTLIERLNKTDELLVAG